MSIHHNLIQVGDVLKIKAGMNIPVDGVMIRSSGVQTNESAMTGEIEEMKKDTFENCKLHAKEKHVAELPSPILLSGTQISTGEGLFVCIVVGN